MPVSSLNDPLIDLFLKIWDTLPEIDHITATKRLKSQGIIKRLVDGLSNLAKKPSSSSKDTDENNVFAPTAALCLF